MLGRKKRGKCSRYAVSKLHSFYCLLDSNYTGDNTPKRGGLHGFLKAF